METDPNSNSGKELEEAIEELFEPSSDEEGEEQESNEEECSS